MRRLVSAAMSTTNDASRGQQHQQRRRCCALLLLLLVTWLGAGLPGVAGARAPQKEPAEKQQQQHPQQPKSRDDPVIEEVTSKQLERLLKEKDFVAVYWCKSRAAQRRNAASRVPLAPFLSLSLSSLSLSPSHSLLATLCRLKIGPIPIPHLLRDSHFAHSHFDTPIPEIRGGATTYGCDVG